MPPLKPRELSDKYGFAALSTSDLLTLILRTGTRSYSVFRLSVKVTQLLEKSLAKKISTQLFLKQLKNQLAIGLVQEKTIGATYELLLRATKAPATNRKLVSPQIIAETYQNLRNKKQERMYGIYLTSQLSVIQDVLIAKGSIDYVLFEPADVLYYAVKYRSRNIVLIHNHPSGDPTPSEDDKTQTKHLMQVAELLGIHVLDHVVIADNGYFSFKEAGYML